MNIVFVLFGVLAAVYGASVPDKIVGGTSVDISRYPNIVQVDFLGWSSWSQGCGAIILTTRYVLSAAHCFEVSTFTASNRRIRAGSSARNSGGVTVTIPSRINHPTYGQTRTMDGDIALVRLGSALSYSTVIQPGTIAAAGATVPDNAAVIHAGWGALWTDGPAATTLQHVTINVINRALCAQRYATRGGVVTANMICAGVLNVGGRDACQGDSGGPLYYGNIVVGVVSWGLDCADSFFPGVNTAVSPYTSWVVANAV